MSSTQYGDKVATKTHENQGGVEVFIVLLHVFGIVLHCLSSERFAELGFGVIVLDR